MTYACRGIRGATTADDNTREAILMATRELLERLIEQNGLQAGDIASAIFSTTPDLNAEFPAVAARELGWLDTALLCTHEMAVPGSLPRCVRVLVHWNTTLRADEIRHVYLRDARRLRPERAGLPQSDAPVGTHAESNDAATSYEAER
jgi:chorismate mutase